MKRDMLSEARLLCLLGVFMLCFPLHVQAAGTVPVSIQYICGNTKYQTAVQAENCFYQAWISAYHMTSCGFNQWTWVEFTNELNGYVPFSPICGYGHVLPVVLPKIWSCPEHSTGSTICTCDNGYKPDPTNTICISECPVERLTNPPFPDACSQALENTSTTQAQKDALCGTLTTAMQTGQACFRDKLANLGTPIPLVVTAGIRNVAYQGHFREIWDKMEALVALMKKNPAMQTVCATRRAEIAAEKGCDNAGACNPCGLGGGRNHCIKARPALPSPNNAQHTQGNAIDLSLNNTITPLQNFLNTLKPPQTIPQFLDAPTDCNLIWGGTFTKNYDPIHFRVR